MIELTMKLEGDSEQSFFAIIEKMIESGNRNPMMDAMMATFMANQVKREPAKSEPTKERYPICPSCGMCYRPGYTVVDLDNMDNLPPLVKKILKPLVDIIDKARDSREMDADYDQSAEDGLKSAFAEEHDAVVEEQKMAEELNDELNDIKITDPDGAVAISEAERLVDAEVDEEVGLSLADADVLVEQVAEAEDEAEAAQAGAEDEAGAAMDEDLDLEVHDELADLDPDDEL